MVFRNTEQTASALRRERLGQRAYCARIAVLEPAVGAVEQLQSVVDAKRPQLPGERLRAQVQEELVGPAGIQIDPLHGSEGIGVGWRHPNGVPLEPPLPHVTHEPARLDLEWKDRLARRAD